jgi:hypothetical protein
VNAPRDPRDGSGSQPGPPDGPRYYPPPASGPASGWAAGGNPGQGGYPGQDSTSGQGGGPGPNGPAYGAAPRGASPYGDQTGYAYNPYGAYPASTGPAVEPPPSRPGLLVLALVLQIVAALPFLFFGVAFLVVPLNGSALTSTLTQLQNDPRFAGTDITPDLLLSLVRTLGVILLVAALAYLLLAVLSFAGRNWARILVAVVSAGFVLALVGLLVAAGGAADTLLVFAVLIVLLVASVVIAFLPAANAWYTHRR